MAFHVSFYQADRDQAVVIFYKCGFQEAVAHWMDYEVLTRQGRKHRALLPVEEK